MEIQDYDWLALGKQVAPEGLPLALTAKKLARSNPAAALEPIRRLRVARPTGWTAWCDMAEDQIRRHLIASAP